MQAHPGSRSSSPNSTLIKSPTKLLLRYQFDDDGIIWFECCICVVLRICRIELAAYSLEVFVVDEASAALQHDSLQTPPRIAIHVEDTGCFWFCLDIFALRGGLSRADVYMLAIECGTDWNVVWHPGRANRGHPSNSLRFDEILLTFRKRHSSTRVRSLVLAQTGAGAKSWLCW